MNEVQSKKTPQFYILGKFVVLRYVHVVLSCFMSDRYVHNTMCCVCYWYSWGIAMYMTLNICRQFYEGVDALKEFFATVLGQ